MDEESLISKMNKGDIPFANYYTFKDQIGKGDVKLVSPTQATVDQVQMETKRNLKRKIPKVSKCTIKKRKTLKKGQKGLGKRRKSTKKIVKHKKKKKLF